jgi:multidrug efflux pump subunit AcrA (membrane-fusion protein)
MKALMIAVSLAVSATTGFAHAAESAPTTVDKTAMVNAQQWSPQSDVAPLTRAQVREELVQAKKSGQIAYLHSTLYRGGR